MILVTVYIKQNVQRIIKSMHQLIFKSMNGNFVCEVEFLYDNAHYETKDRIKTD